jgi:DNA-binding CsgD family transcriptional regulator
VFVALRRAEFALADGDEARASELLERIAETVAGAREPQFIGWHGDLLAQIARRAGDPATARRALDDALDAIEFCSEDRQRIARLAQTGVSVEADAAERARDVGDADAERLAIAGAEAYLSRSEACADPPRPVEQARLATARAEVARARGTSDPQAYADAAAAWREAGRPYPAALNDLDRAAALAAAGERDAAQAALDKVFATAERLGAPWLLAQAQGLAGRARLTADTPFGAQAGELPPAPPAPAESDDPFGLTPRERQVLELLARGATNREIGAELFMAEKTASVHVSRILSKLGVRTRTEAAAVAYRAGLAV